MRARRIVRPVMLFASGLLLSTAAALPAGAQARLEAVCEDAQNQRGEPQLVVAKGGYTVALVANTIKRESGGNRVVAKATILLSNSDLKRGIYPVTDDRGDVVVRCQNAAITPAAMQFMRDVVMEAPGPREADSLAAKLKALTEASGIVLRAKDAQSWPSFILFSKNGFQPVGDSDGTFPVLEPLFRGYPGIQQSPAFLAGLPFQVKLTSSFARPVYTPAGDAAADAGHQGGNPQQAAGSQQISAGKPLPPAAPSRGRPLPPPPQPGVVSGPLLPVDKSPVEVVIRFSANHGDWQKLLDPARLQREPGLFDTFQYCDDLVPVGAGTYKMQCTLRPDRKVPLRIRGFKELLIDPNGPPLDDQLKVAGFSYPYPVSWGRPQTEFVDVPGGNLREVLARRIQLPQGIAGCQTEIAAVSLENIVSGTFTPFPAEPCKKYDLSFQQIQLAPNASVLRGCIAGAPDQAVPIRGNKVTCWALGGQAGTTVLTAHLLDGFNPVQLSVNPIDSAVGFEALANNLQPLWPYAPGIVDLREAPAYEARSVQYVADGGAPCGQPVALVNGAGQLPSLKTAACGQVPRGMTIALLQPDGAAQTASSPPPQAFEPRYDDRIEFASLTQGRTVPVDQLKRQLSVQFSAEHARAFDAQFGTGANNSSTFAGVFLFQGNCTSKREAVKFVPFNGPPTPAAYKWPIKAAVFDSSEDPLTLCTTATVEGAQSGAPYLTFELRGARAVGPRRAIVISMSPNVATRGGSKVVQESLRAFVDQIGAEVAKGGRLSPINVFQVNGAGEFKQLFTGEAAAQDLNAVKQLITQSQESVAPVTPDFRQLRLIPELKKDSVQNFDRVIFVMDGSDAAQDNMDVLAGLANQFKNPDSIQLLMIGSCNPWLQQNQNIKCVQLPADAAQRPDILVKAFAGFINPAEMQAMNPPPMDLRTTVPPPRAQAPAPEQQGGTRAPNGAQRRQ